MSEATHRPAAEPGTVSLRGVVQDDEVVPARYREDGV